jgi:hypothetical protein
VVSEIIEPWAASPGDRQALERRLGSLVGRALESVAYLDPQTSAPWRIKHHKGFDEASMGIVLRTDRGTLALKWLMKGEREGLAVVLDAEESDFQLDRVKRVPIRDSPEWNQAIGARVSAVGVAWHEPTAGIAAVWAVRLGFSQKASVVTALGEWGNEALSYIPDAVVAIFDAALARAYQIPAGEEPAWGHDTGSRPEDES